MWSNHAEIQTHPRYYSCPLTCKNEDLMKNEGLFCRFFRGSRAANYEVSGGILPKFELIQAFIVVLVTMVTYKNEEDPIKTEGARVLTRFSPL